ncbi:STAS domain-containing protein [Sorangium sp. So ce321]|uniref:STAS domain-containing protein n=1 Tax=Sorangium sp. So ce321 TaxID=3133300 RepID=UPI003F5F2FB5
MPCEHCPLERAEGAPPVPLATFLDRLTTCDGCPRLAAEEATPLVRLLADRHREAARAIRGLENEVRKLKRELKEAASAAEEYEGRLATLEHFQKRSSQEVEEELRAQLELVRQQGAEMQAMSTPIIRVWEGVLVLPIIGSVDSARAASMMERLLEEVASSGPAYAIVDLTGLATADAATVNHLVRMSSAVRLLGARVIFTGIQRGVAHALATSGELTAVTTLGTVKEALRRIV